MKLDLFLNFGGDCRQAVEFYAQVFQAEVRDLMTYGDTPPDPNYTILEEDKDKIMYAGMELGGVTVMFMDMPSDSPLILGNQLSPTVSTGDMAEVTRIFQGLAEGGTIYAPLEKTFFSELYGMVEDKFGITWQILYYIPDEA